MRTRFNRGNGFKRALRSWRDSASPQIAERKAGEARGQKSEGARTRLRSVFKQVERVFDDLVLEREQAVFMLPPVGACVIRWRQCGDGAADACRTQDSLRYPLEAAGMKEVSRDDQPFCSRGFCPIAGRTDVAVSAGNGLPDRHNCLVRHTLFDEHSTH